MANIRAAEPVLAKNKNALRVGAFFADYWIYIALLAIVVVLSMATENFLTISNITNVIRQVSFNAILAIGLTFVIITGGIDLSVGSVLALSGIVAASFSVMDQNPLPLPLALLLGLAAGAIFGLVNGILITKGRMAAFIATLVVMTVARGLALVYSNGRPVINYTPGFREVGAGYAFGLPIPIIVLAIVVAISYFVLNHTKFGRHIYAVGGNEQAAKASGLNVHRIKIWVYVISGTLAGLTGIILASRVNAASPITGIGYELDAIAAAVIGGSSLSGGRGFIMGTLIGALIIGIISNGLDILNVSAYYQQIIKGAIICGAVLLDRKNAD
jgi:ribose transport system permease protein